MPEFKTDFQNITKDAWSWVQRHGPKSTIDGTPVRGLMDVRQYVISVYHAHEAWDALVDHLKVESTHWANVPELKASLMRFWNGGKLRGSSGSWEPLSPGAKGCFGASTPSAEQVALPGVRNPILNESCRRKKRNC